MRPATPAEIENWDTMLLEKASPHILQTRVWGECKRACGWQPLYLWEETTATPILLLKKQLPLTGKSLLYVPKGPAADFQTKSSDRTVLVRNLLSYVCGELAKREKAMLVKVECEATEDDAEIRQVFIDHHCLPSDLHPQFKHTMWLDLTLSDTALLDSFKSKTRYNIRLAQKKNIQIKTEVDEPSLRLFFQIHKSTGRSGNFPVRTYTYYERVWKSLIDRDMATLFLAYHEGDLLGGVLLFGFGNRLYYQYGASSPVKRNYMANYLLQWTAMQWGKQHGFAIYDLVGLPEQPDPQDPFYGVWNFKQGFQGETKKFLGAFDYYPKDSDQKFWRWYASVYKRYLWYLHRDIIF